MRDFNVLLPKIALIVSSGQFEQTIPGMRFSRLSSVMLIIPYYGNAQREHNNPYQDLFHSIRCATMILKRIETAYLSDVRVEFKLHTGNLAGFGACLSHRNMTFILAVQALESALLTFPRGRILFRGPAGNRRAGRAELWSPTFQRAFPKLSERGSLVLDVGGESTPFAFMFNSSVTD